MTPTSPNDPDRSFAGGAFEPTLPKGKASGELRVTFSAIEFTTEGARLEMPLSGLKVALGGANDRLVFFTHPNHPQRSFHTADHEILKHRALAQTSELTQQIQGVGRRKLVTNSVLVTVLALVVLVPTLLFVFRGALVGVIAQRIPVEWEQALGEKVFEQIKREGRMLENPALEAELSAITKPLLAGIPDSPYQFQFHIVEDRTLNAFAIPGGHVVIHSGLLLAAEKPEEVAGVLAHEMAHVTRRHSIRNVLSSAGLFVIIQFFLGDASGVLAVIANNTQFLLGQKFSRDFERDADDQGWEYLTRADVNPRGMIDFFKKLEAERKKLPLGEVEKTLNFLSTHPTTDERIERLEARWQATAKKDGYRQFDLNFAQFQNSLRASLHNRKQ
ncbi:MAG: M48 family metallopeptidase [Verrucomicrobiota bacterium]